MRALNLIGWGPYSVAPVPADIQRTAPLKPLISVREGSLTDNSQLHVEWQALTDIMTGYDTITSYLVFWDNGSNGKQFVELYEDSEPFQFSFIEDNGIKRAHYYQFYYMAVNQHGRGVASEIVTIHATRVPSQIETVVTENSGNLLSIYWN